MKTKISINNIYQNIKKLVIPIIISISLWCTCILSGAKGGSIALLILAIFLLTAIVYTFKITITQLFRRKKYPNYLISIALLALSFFSIPYFTEIGYSIYIYNNKSELVELGDLISSYPNNYSVRRHVDYDKYTSTEKCTKYYDKIPKLKNSCLDAVLQRSKVSKNDFDKIQAYMQNLGSHRIEKNNGLVYMETDGMLDSRSGVIYTKQKSISCEEIQKRYQKVYSCKKKFEFLWRYQVGD